MNDTHSEGDSPQTGKPAGGGQFVTTLWTQVLDAADPDSPQCQAALERLCQNYWYPLYGFARRKRQSPADAQDLTQAFFAKLLEREWLRRADRERGRFRTFLLTLFSRFMADEWDRRKAMKRGGDRKVLSLDWEDAEHRYTLEPVDPVTPETQFERNWALAVLERVRHRLGREYTASGKTALFDALVGGLGGDGGEGGYAEVGRRLGLSEGAVKMAALRMRNRYALLLRDEIGQTVPTAADVDLEIRHLQAALRGGG